MKANRAGRKIIKAVDSVVNTAVLVIVMLLLAFAVYALWDSGQINSAADKSHYEIYKPTVENEGKTFKELQALNPEVIAWLSVYGTNIDYPVTQAGNNMKYVNTNAEGLYSLSGAIFLDYHNSKDFSDFNSIVYGHHMDKKTMFGEIGDFAEKAMFDSHRYGNLYFDGQDHGLEFFAFIHTSAYDDAIFTANIRESKRQDYLDRLLANAMYKRDIGVTIDDNIVLLSTCSSVTTNGRDILVGKLTGAVYGDPYANENEEISDAKAQASGGDGLVVQIRLFNLVAIVVLAVLILVILHRSKNRRRG